MLLFASKKAGMDMNTSDRVDEKAVVVVEHHVDVQHSVAFDALVDMIAPPTARGGMVAQSSARVYRDTYTRWSAWCDENAVDALDLTYVNVNMYLAARETSKSSRQRELAALRKLAEVLAVVDYQNAARRAALDSLKLLRVHDAPTRAHSERSKRALTPRDAEKMLTAWRDADDVPEALAARNRAIVATLLLTALRRSELRELNWSDVDFDNGVVHVERGKGGKAREVAVYGSEALEALAAWKLHALDSAHNDAVFTSLRKGGKVQRIRMTATAIYNVVTETARRAGVNHVAPHDCRRTLITELLATGASLQDVQAQAGHARGSTTLLYAKPVDARARRQAARVRYG